MPSPVLSDSTLRTRRWIAWFTIALAAVSLMLTAAGSAYGGRTRWTSWALPILLIANSAVMFLGIFDARPRLKKLFPVVSIALAAVILIAELRIMFRR